MEILCASDLHGDFETLARICGAVRDFDALVIAGDLTNFSSAKIAMHMVGELRPNVEDLLMVPGNCELEESLRLYSDLGISLHGVGRVIGDVGFFGVGGSNITPFNTPLEFGEDNIRRFLNAGYEDVKDSKTKILVSHAPPFEAVDKTPLGVSVGCRAVRDFVEDSDVRLVLCGHIHEAKGEGKIGETEVVNTGPAQDGYVKVTIDDKGELSYEFLKY